MKKKNSIGECEQIVEAHFAGMGSDLYEIFNGGETDPNIVYENVIRLLAERFNLRKS